MRRSDVNAAVRGRTLSLWGSFRELRKLPEYLYEGETVDDVAACVFGTTGGRSLMVATSDRLLFLKDGWIFKNSQNLAYEAIDSVNIRTKIFFSTVTFVARGENVAVVEKVGRFAAKHFCDLVRNRTGHRFETWKAQERALIEQAAQQALQSQQFQPAPTAPAAGGQGAGSFLNSQPGLAGQPVNPLIQPAVPAQFVPPVAPAPVAPPVNPLAFVPPAVPAPVQPPVTASIPVHRPVPPFPPAAPARHAAPIASVRLPAAPSPILKPNNSGAVRTASGRLPGNPLESFRAAGFTF